jgi:hypothetical protein
VGLLSLFCWVYGIGRRWGVNRVVVGDCELEILNGCGCQRDGGAEEWGEHVNMGCVGVSHCNAPVSGDGHATTRALEFSLPEPALHRRKR